VVNFIKLRTANGGELFVQPGYIIAMERRKSGASLLIRDRSDYFDVRESVEEIVELIDKSYADDVERRAVQGMGAIQQQIGQMFGSSLPSTSPFPRAASEPAMTIEEINEMADAKTRDEG
jgi:hypothetical protein